MADEYMTTGQAANALGIGVDRVRQLVREGKLEVAMRLGGRAGYRRADVVALRDERDRVQRIEQEQRRKAVSDLGAKGSRARAGR